MVEWFPLPVYRLPFTIHSSPFTISLHPQMRHCEKCNDEAIQETRIEVFWIASPSRVRNDAKNNLQLTVYRLPFTTKLCTFFCFWSKIKQYGVKKYV